MVYYFIDYFVLNNSIIRSVINKKNYYIDDKG